MFRVAFSLRQIKVLAITIMLVPALLAARAQEPEPPRDQEQVLLDQLSSLRPDAPDFNEQMQKIGAQLREIRLARQGEQSDSAESTEPAAEPEPSPAALPPVGGVRPFGLTPPAISGAFDPMNDPGLLRQIKEELTFQIQQIQQTLGMLGPQEEALASALNGQKSELLAQLKEIETRLSASPADAPVRNDVPAGNAVLPTMDVANANTPANTPANATDIAATAANTTDVNIPNANIPNANIPGVNTTLGTPIADSAITDSAITDSAIADSAAASRAFAERTAKINQAAGLLREVGLNDLAEIIIQTDPSAMVDFPNAQNPLATQGQLTAQNQWYSADQPVTEKVSELKGTIDELRTEIDSLKTELQDISAQLRLLTRQSASVEQ